MSIAEYNNIAFEGGGVKGISYIGAIKILEEKNILKTITRFSGSSVGSMFATALACNSSYLFIEHKFKQLDLNKFLDDSYNFILDAWRLYNTYGYCPGHYIFEWIGSLLKEIMGNADITFNQLFEETGNELIITGTRLNRPPHSVYFSHQNNPDMPIRLAVRISTSIPLVFSSMKFEEDLYIDGGVLDNYPFAIFGDNDKTIGVYIRSDEEEKTTPINSLKDEAFEVIRILLDKCNKSYIPSSAWKNTIMINIKGISSTNFNITDSQKKYLEEQGYLATIEFLNKQKDSENCIKYPDLHN